MTTIDPNNAASRPICTTQTHNLTNLTVGVRSELTELITRILMTTRDGLGVEPVETFLTLPSSTEFHALFGDFGALDIRKVDGHTNHFSVLATMISDCSTDVNSSANVCLAIISDDSVMLAIKAGIESNVRKFEGTFALSTLLRLADEAICFNIPLPWKAGEGLTDKDGVWLNAVDYEIIASGKLLQFDSILQSIRTAAPADLSLMSIEQREEQRREIYERMCREEV